MAIKVGMSEPQLRSGVPVGQRTGSAERVR